MTTPAGSAEIGVKIVIDSNAKQAFDNVKHGLKGVEDAAGHTKHKIDMSLGGNAKQLGMMVAGAFSLSATAALAAGGAIVGLGVKSAEAFMESAKQIKAIANTFTLLDSAATPLDKIKRFAAATKDELEELGIQAGIADDELVTAFNDVLERGGKTVEQAHELTGSMAYASRATAGGITELSAAFEAIQMGVIRAKNPIVGMIAATHELKGNAKQVAQQMMKMTIAEQMEVAERAIGKMADKMKNAPMTLGQTMASMKVAWENIFETAGEPMIKALTPVVGHVRDLFLKVQPSVVGLAETFGENFAKVADVVLPVIDNVFKAANDNAQSIKETFMEVMEPMKDVFEYIYENREAFAKTFVDVMTLVVGAMAQIIKAMAAVYKGIAAAANFLGRTVSSDYNKFAGEEDLKSQSKDIRKTVMASGYRNASQVDRTQAQQKYVESYTQTYGADKAAEGLKDFDKAWQKAQDDHNAVMAIARDNETAARMADTQSFVKAWTAASKAQDAGAMNYVASFLQHNEALVKALAEDGPKMLGNGYAALLEALKNEGNADALAKIKKGGTPSLGLPPKGNIIQNFNGPISVKQDFRDQDPDQIMVMMKRDFAKQGMNRLQSRLGGIYGF